jgi:hypothetical protein
MNSPKWTAARIWVGKTLVFLLILVMGTTLGGISFLGNFLPGVAQASAAKPQDKSLQELSKLLSVLEQFRNTSLKVIFDGIEYDINLAVKRAKQLIRKHFRSGPASIWVKNNLYLSPFKREVIYLKFPDGGMRPLRDVILERLQRLHRISA